jgi:glycosyltransferase involved in cell wall biosynthesis
MNVVFLQASLSEYRIPLFRELSHNFNITVIYSSPTSSRQHVTCPSPNLRFIQLPRSCFFSLPWINSLFSVVHSIDYDLLVIPDHFTWIQFSILRIFSIRTPVIWYGLQKSRLPFYTFTKKFFFNLFRDTAVCYTPQIASSLKRLGFLRSHVKYVNNTLFDLDNLPVSFTNEKNLFLAVGTLCHRKRYDLLIRAFHQLVSLYPHLPLKLIIVGAGPEASKLKSLCTELDLDADQILVGNISDNFILNQYYSSAIACVSPGQAGLTLLQSMAHGVPFITSKGAVNAGELYNLIDGITGLLAESPSSVYSCMLTLVMDPVLRLNISINAYSRYNLFCTSERFIKLFSSAILSALPVRHTVS